MILLQTIALSLTLGLLPAASGGAADAYVDELRGFRMEQPAGWTASEAEDPTYGHVLSLTPPGSKGEVGVRVAILDAGGKSAAELVAAKVAALGLSQLEGLGDFERVDRQLGETACEGLRIEMTQAGTVYRIEQALLVHDELYFTVQYHAPVGDFDARADELLAVVESLTWTERDPAALKAAQREAELKRLAARCGNEVDWAKDWDDASARSKASGKPVLVVAWFLQAFALDNTPRTSTFMDEDVIALVNARFVPLWVADRSALKLHREGRGDYGMGPNTFGQALLVVSADGNVASETNAASNPAVIWPFLVAALGDAGESVESAGQETGRGLVDSGHLDAAWKLFEGKTGMEARVQRARIRRLERRFDEALAILEVALAGDVLGNVDPEARLGVRLARAELLAETGQMEAAQAEALAVAQEAQAGALRARALVVAGAGAIRLGDKALSKSLFEEVTLKHEDTRWASLAAVALKSMLFQVDFDFDLAFTPTDEAALAEALHTQRRAPLARSESGEAATGALRWLLEHQLASGAFPEASNFGYEKALGPNPFVDAGAALAGRALLAADAAGMQRGTEARAAARRALDFVLGSVAAREATPPLVFYMDYMTWSDAVMLDFMADAVEAKLAKKTEVRGVVRTLLNDLAARQQENGGWSYYKKNDLSAADVPAQSISFTTAGVSLALSHVAAAGFDVPEELRVGSTTALRELRDPAGVFAYFLYGSGVEPHPAIADPRGDVGRGPACELALHQAGSSGAEQLEASIEVFLDHAPLFAAQQGKSLMHAGLQGQGCHYLYFDYLHAALGAAELPVDKRRTARLLDLVLDGRQADGSFLDTPITGHTYGTSMALRALLVLDR